LSIEACGTAQPALDTAMAAAAVAPPKRLRWKRARNGIRRFCGTLDLVLQRFAIVDRQTCGGRRDGLEQARLAERPSGDAVNNEGTSVIRIARAFAAAMCAAVGVLGSAQAADYPTRPVKWVVPYPPGGTTDVLARIVAEWLTQKMGQTFIIENKPGAGNNIGVEAVVNAPPDGYTMLLVNPANGINATLYKNLSFNFIRDIAPVAGLVRTPNVMEVTNSLPVKTVQEFIAYCKTNPGKINMASSGSGTSVHLSGELFKSMTGCDMVHVPYKGAGPALTDLMGGQVHVIFDNLPSSIGHIKGGKIRALAVTSEQREPSLPQVPTVAETVPGYEATAWFGIGMPKNTPRDVIEKVNAEVNRALADPKMRERLAELGGKPIAGTPEDFGKVIAAETAKWEKVVISSGAKVE
jgi:tripartite-type tricarboxylate transporter receptor subunit TctC